MTSVIEGDQSRSERVPAVRKSLELDFERGRSWGGHYFTQLTQSSMSALSGERRRLLRMVVRCFLGGPPSCAGTGGAGNGSQVGAG